MEANDTDVILLRSHIKHSIFLVCLPSFCYQADRKRLRINQSKANSPQLSVKMYSPSAAFKYALSGKGYQRNPTPSSLPSVSSSLTCVRSRFMHGIISYRIWKRVVRHRMILHEWVRNAMILSQKLCLNVNLQRI